MLQDFNNYNMNNYHVINNNNVFWKYGYSQYQVKIQLHNKKSVQILILLFHRQNREVGNETDNSHNVHVPAPH